MDPKAKPGKYVEILFSIDEQNNKCADCGKENPTKVSVNNGIIICEECAEKHTQLGTMISYIRDINDDFDEYLLNFFTLGGNSKFQKFLKDENVDTSLPIEQKYKTKAIVFYRKNLKHKVQGEMLIEKNYENPNEILEETENYFPEFENYQLKKEPPKSKTQQAKKVAEKIGSGLFSFGKKMYKKSVEGAKYVGHKASQGASYVATHAQPALKKGATFVGHQVGGVYSNIKNKMVHKEKKDDKKEEAKEENNEKNNEENKGENKENENSGEEKKGEGNEAGEVKEEKAEEKIDDNPIVSGELVNHPEITPQNNEGQP